MRIPCVCFPNKECPTNCPQYQDNKSAFVDESMKVVILLRSHGIETTVEQLAELWLNLPESKASEFAREVIPNRKENPAGNNCFLNIRSN